MRKILVTGGNSGIGLALCKQLAEDHKCFVYLGSRSLERGKKARETIESENVEVVQLDVASDESVNAAAKRLKDVTLYAIVNNAGVGLGHEGVTADDIINVNIIGAKRVVDAFASTLEKNGRIAATSSGIACGYVSGKSMGKPIGYATGKEKACLIRNDVTWKDIEGVLKIEKDRGYGPDAQSAGFCAYGVSKACLCAYSIYLAHQYPNLVVTSCTPGFIATKMTAKYGAKIPPKDGTVSLVHCLFADLGASCKGWYVVVIAQIVHHDVVALMNACTVHATRRIRTGTTVAMRNDRHSRLIEVPAIPNSTAPRKGRLVTAGPLRNDLSA